MTKQRDSRPLPPVQTVREAKTVPGKAKRCAQKTVLGNAVIGTNAVGVFSDESPKFLKHSK